VTGDKLTGGPNVFIVSIDHIVTMNMNYCFTYLTNLNDKLQLKKPGFGHNPGTVDKFNSKIAIYRNKCKISA
jgi:hypothetical protein